MRARRDDARWTWTGGDSDVVIDWDASRMAARASVDRDDAAAMRRARVVMRES